MNNDYCIIYNPVSGNGKSNHLVKRLQEDLNKRNIQYTIYKSKCSGDIKSLCTNEGEKNFIIIGGDGTFNEVINGLFKRKDNYLPYLGLLPGGSGNSVMHDLQATTLNQALELITKNKKKMIDVMKIEYSNKINY